jgi:hypothetical protein
MKACGAEAIAPAVGPTGSPGERTVEDPADEFKQGLAVNDFQEPGRGGERERPRTMERPSSVLRELFWNSATSGPMIGTGVGEVCSSAGAC